MYSIIQSSKPNNTIVSTISLSFDSTQLDGLLNNINSENIKQLFQAYYLHHLNENFRLPRYHDNGESVVILDPSFKEVHKYSYLIEDSLVKNKTMIDKEQIIAEMENLLNLGELYRQHPKYIQMLENMDLNLATVQRKMNEPDYQLEKCYTTVQDIFDDWYDKLSPSIKYQLTGKLNTLVFEYRQFESQNEMTQELKSFQTFLHIMHRIEPQHTAPLIQALKKFELQDIHELTENAKTLRMR